AEEGREQEDMEEQAADAKLRKEFDNTRGAAEAERAKKDADLEHALKQAETRAEAATRDRRAALAELEKAKQQPASGGDAGWKAKYEKLRDSADQQIRSLQLRVSEADERA